MNNWLMDFGENGENWELIVRVFSTEPPFPFLTHFEILVSKKIRKNSEFVFHENVQIVYLLLETKLTIYIFLNPL